MTGDQMRFKCVSVIRKCDKDSFNKIKWIKILLTISLLGKIINLKLIVKLPPPLPPQLCFIDFSLRYF